MNKARLEKLLIAIEGVKPKQFDMTRYAHECGTPACVFGYFAARSDLQKKFKFESRSWGPVLLNKSGEQVDYYDDDVLGYFGITREQADLLFGADENEGATPATMRRRIRKFIDATDR